MNLNKSSIMLAVTAALLAFGPSVQAQSNAPAGGSTNSTSRPVRRPARVMSAESQLTGLSEQLKLTDEQKPKVKAIIQEQNKQMQAARDLPPEERRPKMRSVREETDKKMKEILTPEQYKQFEQTRGEGRRPPRPTTDGSAQ